MRRKHDDNNLEGLVIGDEVERLAVVGPHPANLVHEEHEDLRGAHDHPHEAHVDGCLGQAGHRNQVVWVDVTQLGVEEEA